MARDENDEVIDNETSEEAEHLPYDTKIRLFGIIQIEKPSGTRSSGSNERSSETTTELETSLSPFLWADLKRDVFIFRHVKLPATEIDFFRVIYKETGQTDCYKPLIPLPCHIPDRYVT